MFRGRIDLSEDGPEHIGQVLFGMDIASPTSIGSNEGQYARSSDRSDPSSGSNVSYTSVGSFSKPPALAVDKDVQLALPLAPAIGEGSHVTGDSQSVVFSDVESVGKPPTVGNA